MMMMMMSPAQKVAKGKEVFNTYGQKENAKLLAEYGFVVRPQPSIRNPKP